MRKLLSVMTALVLLVGLAPTAMAAKLPAEKPREFDPQYVQDCEDYGWANNRHAGTSYDPSWNIYGVKATIDPPVTYFQACAGSILDGYHNSAGAWVSLEPTPANPEYSSTSTNDIVQIGIKHCETVYPGHMCTDHPRELRYFWAYGDDDHDPVAIDLGPAASWGAISYSIKVVGSNFVFRIGSPTNLEFTKPLSIVDWGSGDREATWYGETWDLTDGLGYWYGTDAEKLNFTNAGWQSSSLVWNNSNWSLSSCNAYYVSADRRGWCTREGSTVRVGNNHGD